MKLVVPQENDLSVGRLVVLMPARASYETPALRFVERRESEVVFLEPIGVFLEDEDVSETFGLTEALERLRLPLCEIGDEVFFRTRLARITRCQPNDFHAHVAFAGEEVEHYTNLIHLDFTPTLLRLA